VSTLRLVLGQEPILETDVASLPALQCLCEKLGLHTLWDTDTDTLYITPEFAPESAPESEAEPAQTSPSESRLVQHVEAELVTVSDAQPVEECSEAARLLALTRRPLITRREVAVPLDPPKPKAPEPEAPEPEAPQPEAAEPEPAPQPADELPQPPPEPVPPLQMDPPAPLPIPTVSSYLARYGGRPRGTPPGSGVVHVFRRRPPVVDQDAVIIRLP